MNARMSDHRWTMKHRDNRLWIRVGLTAVLIAYAALWHITHGGGTPAVAAAPPAAAVQSAVPAGR